MQKALALVMSLSLSLTSFTALAGNAGPWLDEGGQWVAKNTSNPTVKVQKAKRYAALTDKQWVGVVIQDTKMAEALVKSHQNTWGISGESNSLRFDKMVEHEAGTTYVFHQYLGDLEVFDHGVQIRTDNQGFVTALTVDVEPIAEAFEGDPELSPSEVILKVEARQGTYTVQVNDARLGLTHRGEAVDLAYRLRLVMDGGQFFDLTADAASGEVLEVTHDGALSHWVHSWI